MRTALVAASMNIGLRHAEHAVQQNWAVQAVHCKQRQRRPTARCRASSSSSGSTTGWLLDVSPSTESACSSNGSKGSPPVQYDCIMTLGGGLLPDGGLPEWVLRRLEGSLFLYRQQQQRCAAAPGNGNGASPRAPRPWAAAAAGPCPILLLGAATPHKPPVLDELGYVLYESSAYAAHLMHAGVPARDLLKETQSCDTVGNAYFSLLMHALLAGWRRIAVVTSDFHMPRTRATFDFVYGLAGRQLHGDPAWFCLDYHAVSDEGIFHPEVIAARAAKEAAAVATWQRNTAAIESLADLHSWLYGTHLCYSVSRQHEFGRAQDLDPKLAATY